MLENMMEVEVCAVLVRVGSCPSVPLSSPWADPWVAAASSAWASEWDRRAEPPQIICNLKQSQHSSDTWGKIKCYAGKILWFAVVRIIVAIDD